ncbi:General transcription factor 3C polypeptide 1 [Trichinella britovi]|uniref:General transcription factor 3C polypeptide 1 n=1 Tax=Trichinella britovi TaxID=45882 RepID=A0A0V1CN13_TRIBR|nr:General transcription factor 3C polypeptide 1 [Trichinella britovi]
MSIHLPVTLLSGSSFKESSLSKKVNLTYIIWLCLASAHQIHGALFPATTDNNSNANNDADKNHTHGDENPNPKSSNNYTTVGRSILSSAEVRQVLDIYTVGYRLPLAAKLMEDITVADACVDEIALEGLDGITLNSLWVRLRTRPGLYLRVDDVVKQHLWNLIFHNKELSFYTLPKPRETIDMHCLYIDKLPVNIVKDNAKNLYGSCADFNKRVDITRTFRRTKRYEIYDNVIAKYGDLLVVVASQDLRTTAITGPCYSSELFTKDLSFALYFPVVERIARSRYFGCVTYGNYSLHKVFKIRSKDVFYTLKRLFALKLVKKWPCEVQLEDGSSRICTCVCLKRFASFFKYFPLSRMISYFKSCPQRRATRSQIIQAISVEPFLFDIAKFRMINVLSIQIQQIKVPVHVGKKARNHQSKGENEIRDTCYRLNRAIEEDCEDIVEKDGQKSVDQEEIDDRLFELCCEDQDMEDEWMIVENLDSVGEDDEEQLMEEEVIDEITDLYEENNWLEDITSDEGDEESCSSDESEDTDDDDYITDTSNYQFKYFQNERHAIVRKLHNAGSDGVDHFQLCRQIGIHDKLLRALMPILCKEGHARTEFENDGRKRRLRYYTIHSESHTSHCFQQLFEKTNIDFQSVKFGNSPVTDRSCKRLLMILDLLEEKRVLTAQKLTKHIKDTEKEEGYNYEIDKRCSSGLFDLLEKLKLIKVYQTLLIRGNRKKMVKFLCHVDVQPNDSDLSATIRKERMQFIGTVKANSCPNRSRKRRRSVVSPQKEVPKMKKTDKKDDEKKNLHTENKTGGPKPPFSMPSQFRQVTKLKRDIFNYGYQAKCIRLQSVHEFVFYLVHDYRGDTTKNKLYQAEPSCSVEMENRSTAEPTVFLDELSWRRFLPPLPKQNDISHCWLRISDLLSVLPLSIAIQIYSPDKHVQGLMDYLEDPIKRHYLVLDLPEEMRGDMFNSGKLRTALSEVMDKLCFLGLLTQGPRKAQDHSCLLDVFYFVHSGGYLLDTSTSTCGYAVVSMPVTRYVEYRHDFDELDDLYLYWVHLRSIVLSTPLGFKAMRNKRQKVTALKTNELLNILPRSTLEETMPIVKKPIGPRIGSAGFIPQLFLYVIFLFCFFEFSRHRHSQWVISTINGCGQYVYNHIATLLRKYTTTIIDCVQFFNRTYNLAYIQMKSYKGVVRQRSARYFSPHNMIRRICFYMSGTKKRNVPLYNKEKFYAAVKRKGVAVRGQQRRIRQVRLDYGKADFSTEEWTLILLIRSLNTFFTPVGKNVGDIETACELMRHYLPLSHLHQSNQKIRNRIFNIFTKDATFCSSAIHITNQLADIEIFQKFKKQYMGLISKASKKKQIFKEAFEILQQMFWKPCYSSLDSPILHSNFKNYVSKDVKKHDADDIFQSETLKMENVTRCVFANIFMSALCLSLNANSKYEQLLNIYRSFPDEVVTDVPSRLRNDDIITVINAKKLRDLNKNEGGLSNQQYVKNMYFNLEFSNSFRKLLPNCSISSIFEDSLKMHEEIFADTETYHEVMTDSVGHLLAIAGLACQEKIMFDVVMRREQMTLTNHDYSPDVGKMPIFIPDEDWDDDINDNESKRKCLKIVDTVQQSLPDLLASESNIRSTNRIVLLALRKARLISLGNCDLRSLNTKVQELRLKFSDVYVHLDKSKLSYERARSSLYSRGKMKLALENVAKVFSVDTTEHRLTNNTAVKLFEKISKLGYSGIKLSEAQTLVEECSKNEEALKLLLKKRMIFIAGLNVPRFVSRKCIKPWGVHTFYDFNSTDAKNSFVKTQKTPVDNDENDDPRINTFMMPRLWLMPDGELNWPVLRWCCEVIYLHILRSPGLTEESLMKELMPGFYPCITFEIIMFLVDIGCLTRHVFTVKRKRFTIFDVEIGNSVQVVSLEPTPNGQDILYKTFENIPLPNCMKQQELTTSVDSSDDE